MDPDQWFRLWLALIQAVGSGLITLGGGYLGYRLAGRADRSQRNIDSLKDLDHRLRSLTDAVESAMRDRLGRSESMDVVWAEWAKIENEVRYPSGSLAGLLVTEMSAHLWSAQHDAMVADEAGSGELDDPLDFGSDVIAVINVVRSDCLGWTFGGPPNYFALRRRQEEAKRRHERARMQVARLSMERFNKFFK
jgi:hypothetical protein